ncbi:MAG: SDR family oxidoreductase [Rhodothermales bacterium]|nr:SDR family oxidoreductase [Rhodothermales bacterium]
MRPYYSGKTILITGASGGIGEAMARALAPMHTRLLLAARSKDRLDALVRDVQDAGSDAVALPVDLADASATHALADAVLESGHTVDVLVNNAGVGHIGPFEEQASDELAAMLQVNVSALAYLTHRFWPQFPRGGGVLFVASTAAIQPVPTMAAYAATKAFVLSLGEALHTEGVPRGIRVTTLCPGPTATGFFEAAGTPDHAMQRIAMTADDVALAGLEGFAEGKRVVIPGKANTALAAGSRLTPNALLVPALGRAYRRLGGRP